VILIVVKDWNRNTNYLPLLELKAQATMVVIKGINLYNPLLILDKMVCSRIIAYESLLRRRMGRELAEN
ncbi:MAG: hypothetical protein L0L35_10600, partial [Enterococcus sp.]|nr:hypothetical protein [Enterococcus sp.]